MRPMQPETIGELIDQLHELQEKFGAETPVAHQESRGPRRLALELCQYAYSDKSLTADAAVAEPDPPQRLAQPVLVFTDVIGSEALRFT